MINTLNKNLTISKKQINIILNILVILGTLFVPTFLSRIFNLGTYNQIIIGTIVNMSLILSSIYFKGIKNISIVTLPSISTILTGILFQTNIYTLSLIPVIWLGNFTLSYIFKKMYLNNKSYILTSIVSIISKTLIIYLGFNLLNIILNIPNKLFTILNTSMGITQLLTASLACILSYPIIQLFKNK